MPCLPEVLTVKETAAVLRCGLTTAYDMVESGQLKTCRVGRGKRGIRVLASSVEEILRGSATAAPAPQKTTRSRTRAQPDFRPFGHGL